MSFDEIFGDEEMSVDQIRKKLIEACDSYYNNSVSIMSDEDFDNLKDELRRISPNDSFFNSIGAEVDESSAWKKEKHKIPMGSLNKVNTQEEFEHWCSQVEGFDYTIMIKADGISIDLEYDEDLKKAITRGDGTIGEDIFENVKQMKNVKTKIPGFKGSLRGEIVIHKDDFAAMNIEAEKNGDRIYKNPRNAASGVARNFDGKYAKYCTVLFFDCTSEDIWESERYKLADIETVLGLDTVWNATGSRLQVIGDFEGWEKYHREQYPFEIDGMVIAVDNIEQQKKLGMAYGNLKGKIAWKFGAIKKETVLEDVVWEVGLNRRITPVGKFTPTPLGGITVENASIHNLEIFQSLNLGRGDRVIISRRNDVIPYLENVVEHKGEKFQYPILCPVCAESTEIEGKFLICPNDGCEALYLGNLQKWINVLDIMNISYGTIEKLFKAGKLIDPSDLYRLSVNDFVDIDGLGERSGTKIVNHIQAKKEIDLATFIGGLNINGFSSKICAKVIKSGIPDLASLLVIDVNTLCKIPGIKDRIARRIVDGLKTKKRIIENLLVAGVKIVSSAKALNIDTKSDKLNGMSFVFTGAVQKSNPKGERYTREDLQRMVIENGGENHNAVKKGTTFLVQADPSSSSSKTKKAISLGTKILGENEFFKLIEA